MGLRENFDWDVETFAEMEGLLPMMADGTIDDTAFGIPADSWLTQSNILLLMRDAFKDVAGINVFNNGFTPVNQHANGQKAVVLCPPAQMRELENTVTAHFDEYYKSFGERASLGSKTSYQGVSFVAPIQVDNNHWVLALIDFNTDSSQLIPHQVYYIDPNADANSQAAYKARIFSQLHKMLHINAANTLNIIDLSCNQQGHDGRSCGLITIENAVKFLTNGQVGEQEYYTDARKQAILGQYRERLATIRQRYLPEAAPAPSVAATTPAPSAPKVSGTVTPSSTATVTGALQQQPQAQVGLPIWSEPTSSKLVSSKSSSGFISKVFSAVIGAVVSVCNYIIEVVSGVLASLLSFKNKKKLTGTHKAATLTSPKPAPETVPTPVAGMGVESAVHQAPGVTTQG